MPNVPNQMMNRMQVSPGINQFSSMPMQNVQMSQASMGTRAASPMNHPVQINMGSVPAMGMSPSRMPQAQGMMGAHANSMVGQTPSQAPFMSQPQFPASTSAMNVSVGLSQPGAQSSVTQQQQQNASLPINALSSMGSQLPCAPPRATPPPAASATAATANLQQIQPSSRASTPTRPPRPASSRLPPPHRAPRPAPPRPAPHAPAGPARADSAALHSALPDSGQRGHPRPHAGLRRQRRRPLPACPARVAGLRAQSRGPGSRAGL
ncbi:hypothetical protein ANANG_G00034770 [Anguilla anguilla]|uniref:Uncharacterized protein n=1 Tax=Anguilla anguilla TaxID=7936 RepID=A0A9D3MSJ2_ANGAN|nr:hypothetical protein ANANG_G00034770 [Anguilla anguilla]